MTRRPSIRDFDQFRDLISAYRLPRLLLTALDLDLFTALHTRSMSVAELAGCLRASERGIGILCRNLAAAGVLRKRGDRYANGKVSGMALNAKASEYRGAYLDLLRRHWADWSKLTASVRTGRPVDKDKAESPAYRRRFTWAMHHRSLNIAPKVAAQLDLRAADTLLDLGGGPGTYALAFLARNPRLRATVCDRPAAMTVARTIARSVAHGKRLSYLPLDFMKQPIPGRYDVVWYSNVLHIYSPEANRALLRKLAGVIAPGGRLLIQDALCWDREGILPEEASLFAATMLLFTEAGNTYAAADVIGWLKAAGFRRVRALPLKKGMEDWEDGILEATRPERPAGKPDRPEQSVRS